MTTQAAIAAIKEALGKAGRADFRPKLGVVLGSGLGAFADNLQDSLALPYDSLPGFPGAGVAGHAGRLVLGYIGGAAVAALQGRAHYYEHGRADAMYVPLATLKALGCEAVLLTNAAGSLRPEMTPGALMMITDHISLVQASPLVGETGNARFVDMVDAYDPALRAGLRAAAVSLGTTLYEGVYVWFVGPQFETPAEIRAARILGGDAVGMSTAPETVIARRLGIRVAGLSVITNLGAGLSAVPFSHAHTLQYAAEAVGAALPLITRFAEGFAQ